MSSSISLSSSLSLTESELREVRAKLSAVELLLMSFSVPGERERLGQRLGQNQWLALYLDLTKEQLREEKCQLQKKEEQLQEEKLLLLRKEAEGRAGECLSLPLGVWLRAGCCSAEEAKGFLLLLYCLSLFFV